MITHLKGAAGLLKTAARVVRAGFLPTPTHLAWALEADDYVQRSAALGYGQDDAVALLHEAVERGGSFPLALRLAKLGWRPVDGGIS